MLLVELVSFINSTMDSSRENEFTTSSVASESYSFVMTTIVPRFTISLDIMP